MYTVPIKIVMHVDDLMSTFLSLREGLTISRMEEDGILKPNTILPAKSDYITNSLYCTFIHHTSKVHADGLSLIHI